MSKYQYGELPNIPEGTTFRDRNDLHERGVHRPPMGGICGSSTEAAESIVVSGGYEDDQDLGDEIIYTGQGGNDPKTGKQIANQELNRGNMGLVLAMRGGVPVRVIRGANSSSPYAPAWGYRYDGLFYVDDYWQETGKSGFRVWRFRLRKVSGRTSKPKAAPDASSSASATQSSGNPVRAQAPMPPPQQKPSDLPKLVVHINETRIRHKTFGDGVVIGTNGEDSAAMTIKVRFDDATIGEKQLGAYHPAVTVLTK